MKAVLNVVEEGWELLTVDDGSTDHTPDLLLGLAGSHPELCVSVVKRNAG